MVLLGSWPDSTPDHVISNKLGKKRKLGDQLNRDFVRSVSGMFVFNLLC